jgi:hypothetical protein
MLEYSIVCASLNPTTIWNERMFPRRHRTTSLCFHACTVLYFFQFFHCVCSLSGPPISPWRQYSSLLPLAVPGTVYYGGPFAQVPFWRYTVYFYVYNSSPVLANYFFQLCIYLCINFKISSPRSIKTNLRKVAHKQNRTHFHRFLVCSLSVILFGLFVSLRHLCQWTELCNSG